MIKLNSESIDAIKKAFDLPDLNPVDYDKEILLSYLDDNVSESTALLLIDFIDDKKEEYGFTENYTLTPIGAELTFARDYIGSQLFSD